MQKVQYLNIYHIRGEKNPLFSQAKGEEVWVLFLEKAYAKVYGSYEKIVSGLSGEAFRDLTGAPSESFEFNGSKDADRIYKIIYENLKKNYTVTTGSKATQGGDKDID